MLSGFFGGKRPPETPPSQGATRGADARARASSSAEAAGGVVLGPSDARSTSERNPERRDPDDIPDGDMPALFERCQDLLAKTTKRADIGAKTVRVPRTLTFRLSFRARRPRGTPQLSNQKTYVSPHDDDDDDDDPPTSLTQPEDESRQFLRLNMIKRLVARLRAGLDEPAVLDAGERLAWAAQIEFLEEDVDRAVERVTGMAHERDPPTPKRDAADAREDRQPRAEDPQRLGGMFVGLDVGGTPAGASSSFSGGADSGDLFSGLDLTPPPPPPPPPPPAAAVHPLAAGGVAGLGALDEAMFGGGGESPASAAAAPPPSSATIDPPQSAVGGKNRRRGKVRVGYARDDDATGAPERRVGPREPAVVSDLGGLGPVPVLDPSEPLPLEPVPAADSSEPSPLEPSPLEPSPLEPSPSEPSPLEPSPLEPVPVADPPSDPSPSEPVPARSTAFNAAALLAAVRTVETCELEAAAAERRQMDLCEAEDYDGAEALNRVVDDLRARALKAEAEALKAEALIAEALRDAFDAIEKRAAALGDAADGADAEAKAKRARASGPEEKKTRAEGEEKEEEEEERSPTAAARARSESARDARDAAAEDAARASARAKAARDARDAEVRESEEFAQLSRAKSSADAARLEREALEREIESMRRALAEKECALEREVERERVLRREEETLNAALTRISESADKKVKNAEADAKSSADALVVAEAALAEALDAARRAEEEAVAARNAAVRLADEAEAKRDALNAVEAAGRALEAAAAKEQELETALTNASRRAVTAALERRVGKDVVAGAMTRSHPRGPESLRKTAAVRRAECERLATEAESEEEAKRSAASARDFKEAAARSKAAKDLRESAEVARREADELEAEAARMEAEAEDDTERTRDGDGEAEDPSMPADPTEAYKKLKASREEASVETWRARRFRVLAESTVEPEDSPASVALRAVAEVLEARIKRRERELEEDAS